MESSIAEFLERRLASELLPTRHLRPCRCRGAFPAFLLVMIQTLMLCVCAPSLDARAGEVVLSAFGMHNFRLGQPIVTA